MLRLTRPIQLWAVASIWLLGASFITNAQDPGAPQASTATLPSPPQSAGGDFTLVTTGGARQLAEEYVAGKGWSVGWDLDKSWGVWIGDSTLMAADATGLSLGLLDATLDAKFQMAEYLAGVTEGATLRTSMKNPEQRAKEREHLDTLTKQPGGDPVAAGIRDLLDSCSPGEDTAGVAIRSRITNASKTSAQTAIPGMIIAATFAKMNDDGLDGTISVVVIQTPRSRQMADAILGRGPAVTGTAKESIKQFVDGLSPAALVYSTGATTRMNDKGELCFIGFGVGSVDGTEAEEQRLARDDAMQDATASIRYVAGEWIEGDRLNLKTAEKTKYVDGTVESTSVKSQQSRIASLAAGLQMPGVVTVLEKTFDSPKLGRLVCIVREWNLSQAKNAAFWRETLRAQGGWKGGTGVQPDGGNSSARSTTPTPPVKKSVPSGSGGAGVDED